MDTPDRYSYVITDSTLGLSVDVNLDSDGEVIGLMLTPRTELARARVAALLPALGLRLLPAVLAPATLNGAEMDPAQSNHRWALSLPQHRPAGSEIASSTATEPATDAGAATTASQPAAPASPPANRTPAIRTPAKRARATDGTATRRAYHRRPADDSLMGIVAKLGARLNAAALAKEYGVPKRTAESWLAYLRAKNLLVS